MKYYGVRFPIPTQVDNMERHKYPRTYHLPWSQGASSDDKVLKNVSIFEGAVVNSSLKMDGECTTLYRDYYHARSIDSKDHESRHWLKSFHASIRYNIPEGWRVCGENMYAVHSIKYRNLESYFYVFSVWTDKNMCLSLEDTRKFCDGLFTLVPDICCIPFNVLSLKKAFQEFKNDFSDVGEGYVVRNVNSFHYDDFGMNVAKFVRAGHVQTDQHWMFRKIERNELR